MIIDAHTHLPSEGWPDSPREFATVDAAVQYLRVAGTDSALFNTWRGVLGQTEGDLHQANADALRRAVEYPDFLYPCTVVSPLFLDASLEWLARFRDLGYLWVGELIPPKSSGCYADTAGMQIWDACARHGHILQLHVHADLVAIARAFPDMTLVCSHIDTQLLDSLAAESNMMIDISGWVGGLWIGGIEKAVIAFGSDRVLYGTDFTGYEPRSFQARLAAAVPETEERERILWHNVERVLRQAGGRGLPR